MSDEEQRQKIWSFLFIILLEAFTRLWFRFTNFIAFYLILLLALARSLAYSLTSHTQTLETSLLKFKYLTKFNIFVLYCDLLVMWRQINDFSNFSNLQVELCSNFLCVRIFSRHYESPTNILYSNQRSHKFIHWKRGFQFNHIQCQNDIRSIEIWFILCW